VCTPRISRPAPEKQTIEVYLRPDDRFVLHFNAEPREAVERVGGGISVLFPLIGGRSNGLAGGEGVDEGYGVE
jgi:hypothetical protein